LLLRTSQAPPQSMVYVYENDHRSNHDRSADRLRWDLPRQDTIPGDGR